MEEYNAAVEAYHLKWHELVAARTNAEFFESLQATSIGWKTQDRTDFNERFAILRDLSDQVHLGWINERWLATFHLKGVPLTGDISLVKLMERRPGSSDAVGLDHLDYRIRTDGDAVAVLEAEPNLQWSEEKNGENCKWLSVWFAGTEAKLRRDTVLAVCAAELTELDRAIEAA